jgi:glycerophosphoryl diester phosphodiesterase
MTTGIAGRGLRQLGVALLATFIQCATLTAMEIVAHRGASYDAPENTLASMKLAWEQQADAIELDLWLSKDGRLVVCHDADTERIGGSKRKIVEQTWAELQQLDAGAWKAPRFKGERVPTLDPILATIPPGKRAVLEIKCGPEIVPELSRVIQKSGRLPAQIAIISFNFEALKASKKEFPQIEHHFLHGYKKDPKTGRFPELEPLLEKAKAGGFDGLDLQFDWPINKDFVAKMKAAGLKLLVWTVDDPAVARRLREAGVESLTTNRPGWMKEQLR